MWIPRDRSASIVQPAVGDDQRVIHYAYSSADGRIGFRPVYELTQRDPFDGGPALYLATGLSNVFELSTGFSSDQSQ